MEFLSELRICFLLFDGAVKGLGKVVAKLYRNDAAKRSGSTNSEYTAVSIFSRNGLSFLMPYGNRRSQGVQCVHPRRYVACRVLMKLNYELEWYPYGSRKSHDRTAVKNSMNLLYCEGQGEKYEFFRIKVLIKRGRKSVFDHRESCQFRSPQWCWIWKQFLSFWRSTKARNPELIEILSVTAVWELRIYLRKIRRK